MKERKLTDALDLAKAQEQSGPVADKVHRWATLLSYLLIIVMIGVFYIHVQAFRQAIHYKGVQPHYTGEKASSGRCDDCHDYPTDMCESHDSTECMECHKDDGLARKLIYDSILVLCTECHPPNVYLVYSHDGKKKEMELLLYHPYGQQMTDDTYPLTLPLSDEGKLDCVTCHDVHEQNSDRYLLRLYDPHKPLPESVLPLCLDCHHQNGVL